MPSRRATRWSPALAPLTGNLGRLLRERELSFRTRYNHEGPGHISDKKHEPIPALDQTSQSLESKDAPCPQQHAPSWHLPWYTRRLNPVGFIGYIQRTVAKEVSREYSRGSVLPTQEADENADSDLFISSTADVKSRLKKIPASL